MRGTGQTFSRLPAARAMLAGAAFFATATAGKAVAQSDETAMAVPRLAPLGASEIALPQPLDPFEAVQVRLVFAAQAAGDWAGAEHMSTTLTLEGKLGEDLRGYILADRFLQPHASTSPAAIAAWLDWHADLAITPAIAALYEKRDPHGAASRHLSPLPALAALAAPEDTLPDMPGIRRNPLLDRTLRERIERGRFDQARHLLAITPGLTALYGAELRAEIADGLFASNNDRAARELAQLALRESDGRVALAGFVAGLSSWRLGQRAEAARFFERAANAPIVSPSLLAAARFWAARAHAIGDNPADGPERARLWLRRAAAGGHTFYGLLARYLLGEPLGAGVSFAEETLGEADIAAVAATPEGLRAFALLQVGQDRRARDELRLLAARPETSTDLRHAVMLIAAQAGFTALAAEIAGVAPTPDAAREVARFPIPRLAPRHGFRLDPPLVYALTRIESNFDAGAVSAAGARGLMQIMPVTAGYLANDPSLAGARQKRLHDPAFNLDLGQSYLLYLAAQDGVDGDLLRLLAAYNAGPGNVAHWRETMRDGGDPLLFIEAIPIEETRQFVHRALAYSWIYAAKLHLPAPTLAALASGRFPRLRSVDNLVPTGTSTEAPIGAPIGAQTPPLH